MPDYPQNDLAAKWRERAKEMRDLARNMNEPDARMTMLKLADLYDQLADLRLGLPHSERDRPNG